MLSCGDWTNDIYAASAIVVHQLSVISSLCKWRWVVALNGMLVCNVATLVGDARNERSCLCVQRSKTKVWKMWVNESIVNHGGNMVHIVQFGGVV